MGFREVVPQRNTSKANVSSSIRASFPRTGKDKKSNMLNMYIGIDIAKKFGFKDGDKISFNVDESNPRIWLLLKSEDGIGYTLIDSKKGKGSTNLRMQMTWKEFIPDEKERPIKELKYDIHKGGLRIFANI